MDIDDRFRGISVFMQTANAGSFTLAAERMGLTTSAVGKSIARLEVRLGTRLFHRSTRHLSLTDDGKGFLDSCLRASAELEAGRAALDSRKIAPVGRLRVDLPTVFGRQFVMPVLFDLTNRFSELELEVRFNNRMVNLIDEGVDLAIRIGELEDSSNLVARWLGQHKLVVCGSADYLRMHGIPASPDDLASHRCIAHGRGDITTPWFFARSDGSKDKYRVRGHLQFGNVDVIADAVRMERGLGQLPTWLVNDELASGTLVSVLDEYSTEGVPIHAVWPKVRHTMPKVRVVVDELVRHFAATMP
ncbi:LysR family transcriptional regulator [Paraburkholderia dipogonis]|uniref:LysR family transcriptional regulator n=1 Tax=Paraburkholderia dipogonis TaxID=1211383 RepID=A0A4Y8MNW1_9BURK|nr:LysR family transcriptional regulator [Paraburkholderia dipogonis]TFE39177.1 LysR family transcriptional regulator [Paraburkholderia dipogonis]